MEERKTRMQLEIYAKYLTEEKILIVVIEGIEEVTLASYIDTVAKELPRRLGLKKPFSDFLISYYETNKTLCLWSEDENLQNALIISILERYAWVAYKNWIKICITIGGSNNETKSSKC